MCIFMCIYIYIMYVYACDCVKHSLIQDPV